jgi:hypothetical protein
MGPYLGHGPGRPGLNRRYGATRGTRVRPLPSTPHREWAQHRSAPGSSSLTGTKSFTPRSTSCQDDVFCIARVQGVDQSGDYEVPDRGRLSAKVSRVPPPLVRHTMRLADRYRHLAVWKFRQPPSRLVPAHELTIKRIAKHQPFVGMLLAAASAVSLLVVATGAFRHLEVSLPKAVLRR